MNRIGKSPKDEILKNIIQVFFLLSAYCCLLILCRLFVKSSLIFDQIFIICLAVLGIFLLAKNMNFLKIKIPEFKILIISILLFFILGTSILMNVDRSRSIYVFKWIDKCQEIPDRDYSKCLIGSRNDESEIVFRIKEQITRKLVVQENARYKITFVGKTVLVLSNKLSYIFSLEGYKNA